MIVKKKFERKKESVENKAIISSDLRNKLCQPYLSGTLKFNNVVMLSTIKISHN